MKHPVEGASMIRERIKEQMERDYLFKLGETIGEKDDLFKSGIIDSFGYIKLIKYLEGEFNVDFSESELMNVEVTFDAIVKKVTDKIDDLES